MARRCIVVGMDGVSPHFVERMIGEGMLPNFKRMMDEGTFAPHFLSSMPTSTPENWTTIATGAWNGTHQVMSFQTFQPPELHGNWMAGYWSGESEAEFVWDALERAGMRSVLLKYPASHPPTMKTGVQVCGCHVRPCAHQIDGAHFFSTREPRSTPLALVGLGDGESPLQSALPVLGGELQFEARGLGAGGAGAALDERTALYGVPDAGAAAPTGVSLSTPVCKLVPPGKCLYLFLTAASADGYGRAVVSRDPACTEPLAEMQVGQWSDWLCEVFETVDGPRDGSFRLRLERLSPDGADVGLYATQVMDVEGFASPPGLGRELYERVGPFITDIGWEGLGHGVPGDWFGGEVFSDLAEYQHNWFTRAIEYLSSREWSLLMLQAHCIDCANHHCLAEADPATNPDRKLGEPYLRFIEGLYASLDRMLGRVLDMVDDETAVFVVSDHGGMPGHIRVDTRHVLEEAGLLVRGPSGDADRTRSRTYIRNGIFVNVNLAGRDVGGVVSAADFDRICDEVKAALHAYVEPTTGLHPYNLVVRKVDARYVGLYGDPGARKVGDVLFTLREPFGGTHAEQLSTAVWGMGSNGSLLLMRGPGIRRGVRLSRTAWLVDVVPTLCHLLGTLVPRDCEGAILYQALE